MKRTIKLIESENSEFFKTDGLNIACNVCIDNGDTNTNCKEVSEEVVKAALSRGIDCEVVEPFVIQGGDEASQNGHYAIKVEDKLIDYTIMQFLGDSKTVKYFELAKNGNDIYALSNETMQPVKVNELDGANLEEIYSIASRQNLTLELL